MRRSRSFRRWSIACVAAIVVLASGCARADLPPTQAAAPTTTPTTDGTAPTTASTTTPDPSAPDAPDPLGPPVALDDPAAVCDVLRSGAYGIRRRTLDSLSSAVRGAAEGNCPDAITATARAVAIRTAIGQLDSEPVAAELRSCTTRDGQITAVVDIENRSTRAVGALVSITVSGAPEQPGLVFVRWALPPRQPIAVQVRGPRRPGSGGGACELRISAFVNDPDLQGGDPPAADDGPTSDDTVGTWLPAVLDVEAAWQEAGDPLRVGDTEDLRSLHFSSLVLAADTGNLPAIEDPAVEVCSSTSADDGSRLTEVTWAQGQGADRRVLAGVFRRGGDGRWRWLSDARTVLADGSCADLPTR